MRGICHLTGGAAIVAICSATSPVQAQSVQRFDIEEQDLAAALKDFATASGREVAAEASIIAGKRSVRVKGDYRPERALTQLLSRSGLAISIVEGAFVIRPLESADENTQSSDEASSEIIVTGSRIRGAPVASSVITVGREDIAAAGQADLGDVVRSIPQSFGGGQNPGVGATVPAVSGVNVGGGSSINLRGLGSDATLTLLNGRRLPYSASRQSVDVSTIPVAAVERLEIVADGASAIYGSDAVAGVANIVLRRDVEGIETSARVGGSLDGGNFQQLYGIIGGVKWRTGGAYAGYEFSRSTAIDAEDRDYARTRRPGVTLFPPLKRSNAIASGHQHISERAELRWDALYNYRTSAVTLPLNAAGNLAVSRGVTSSTAKAFVLSSQLDIDLDGGWRLSLIGGYGKDHVCFRGDTFTGAALATSAGGCYDNASIVAEIGGDGPLLDLPGGPLKLAAGAGFRHNNFMLDRGANDPQSIDAVRESTYAYGELSLPVVSPAMGVPFINSLRASAAARVEHYPDSGDVVTPKLGLIYAPVADIDVKLSWGRSFRTPTFFQQYQVQQVVLYRATSLGGSAFPAGSTVLAKLGGNNALLPERARSWSATVSLHPRSLPGATLDVSYFATRYVDRIVNPLPFLSQTLSNPIYSAQVALAPTTAQKAAVVAAAPLFSNAAGAPYDPATVIAIVDGRNINAGRQTIKGVDVLARYTHALSADASLSLSVNASYLDSDQQITPTLPIQQLAGIIFNPPHWRARGLLVLRAEGFSGGATLSRIGGVQDRRTAQAVGVEGMTTLDLTARYGFRERTDILSNLDVALGLQNAFNAAPDPIATTSFFDTPYDSTNYSPVGRFASLSLTKRW